jgi:PIN domain nuclease of toxin-antitoxin system
MREGDRQAGRTDAWSDLHEHVLETGVRVLGLSADHGLAVARLPLHHRDPFDRLLIAQARQDGLTLVTADPRIHAYDVAVLDPLA